MEHELFFVDSFEQAARQAQRLSEEYSLEVGVRRKGQGWLVVGPVDPEDPQQWRRTLELEGLKEAVRKNSLAQQEADAIEQLSESRDSILANRYPNGELDETDPQDSSGRTYREILREIEFYKECEPDPEWRDG